MILSDEEFLGANTPSSSAQNTAPDGAQPNMEPKRVLTDEEFMGQLTPESQKKVQKFQEESAKGQALLRGALQGFTLGYGPELAGGALYQQFAEPNPAMMLGLGTPPDYANIPAQAKTITEKEKKANVAAQEAHPVVYGVGNIAGSFANPIVRSATGIGPSAIIGAISGASEGETPSEKTKGAVIGGVSGGILGGMLKNFASGSQEEINQAIEQARKMGIEVPRYMASPNLVMQSSANILRNLPIAGTPIEKSARKMAQQMGTAADNLGGVDPEFAGRIFGDNIKNWIQNTSKKAVESAYDKVSTLMDPKVTTPLDNTANIIAQIAAENVEAAKRGPSAASQLVLDAVQRPGGLNYNGLKNLRTSIGEHMDQNILPADMSGAELKRIYGALTQDLETAAQNAGGSKGAAAHAKANDIANMIANKRESLVSLLGGKTATASNENVFGNIISAASKTPGSADIDLLRQAKSVMSPEDWQRASSGAIAHMGRDADGNFSPTRFLGPNGYNKLSEAGKNELFGPIGSKTRDSLETLAEVSRQFGNYLKYGNPSGTGHAVVGAETLKEAIKHPLDVLVGVLGGKKAAEIISNPATSEWAQAYLKAMPESPIGSSLGLAGEGAGRAAFAALKAATKNLVTVNAKETGETVASLTKGLWKPTTDALGLTGDDAKINKFSGGSVGRVGRASGGKVSHDIGPLVSRLMGLANQAKKATDNNTKPLLDAPDASIVKALRVANQAI